MEPERQRDQFQPLRALRARASRQAGPRNTTQESSKFFIGMAKRDGLGWMCKLIEDTLADPAQGLNDEVPDRA